MKGGRPDKHLVEQHAQTVEVAARSDSLAHTLFGRHVTRRADDEPEPVVAWVELTSAEVARTFATPKSSTHTPRSLSMMFEGLRSR